MAYWTIPVRNCEEYGSSEDQYKKLKAERDELARKVNELSEVNRRLRSKCAYFETNHNKMASRTDTPKGVPDKIQTDYKDLFKAYDNLQREHRALTDKHKSSLQQIAKLRKEVQTLKLRCAAPRQSNTCSTFTRHKPIVSRANAVIEHEEIEGNKENLLNTLGQLQLRLNGAERQLQMLRRDSMDGSSTTQDKSKLHQMQSQHELDVSMIKAQTEKLNKILSFHKEYHAKYRKLKEEMHQCQGQKEILENRIAELEDCEEQVEELSKQNRFLDRKVTELSTLSTSKEETDKYEKRSMLEQLEKTRNECSTLKEENNVLREKNSQLHSALKGKTAAKSKELPNYSPLTGTPPNNLRDIWQQLDRAQQRCMQKENELRQANDMLQAQIASNRSRYLIAQGRNTEDLTFKAASRLKQIRALEFWLTVLHRDTCLNSSLEVIVHSAALNGLGGDTKSFVLLSFHSFGSELSNIVSGGDPNYDLRVAYEFHKKLPQGCIHVEIYVLRDASPRLFAHTSVSTLVKSPLSTQLLCLDLLQDGVEGTVGKLSLSVRLVLPNNPCTMEIVQFSGQKRVIKDAISVSITSVTLSNQLLFDDQSIFFVHYRFLSFGGATTDSKMANFKGLITFNHKSSFSIASKDDGSFEPIYEEISRGIIQFTLFSIRKEDSVGDETDVEDFRVVGEARVPLTDIWNDVQSSAEIVSLDEAEIVGSMHMTIDTTVKPKLLTGTNRNSLRASAPPLLMDMLTEIISTIGESESRTVHSIRLLHFIDPPTGIMETAMILQHELKSEQLQGQSLSSALSLPPEKQYTHCSDLLQYSDEMRKQTLLAQIPPNDEMEDLYQYLSNSDGQICIHELNFFVSSAPLKRVALACRLLREMKICIRSGLLRNKMIDGGEDALHDTIGVPELSEYFTKVMNDLSEVDLIRLASLISVES